ncbi:hypothetical protein CEXT_569071 [Caerostris extrusa]|uniref:Uncharacterized protein n=1 Tax=Caerostris extrusa TaxID=172846 RepID=A0AAV4QYW6_CAEEX|nr:hypothetical protein CEXT_569071 [Caerostris extrusa]
MLMGDSIISRSLSLTLPQEIMVLSAVIAEALRENFSPFQQHSQTSPHYIPPRETDNKKIPIKLLKTFNYVQMSSHRNTFFEKKECPFSSLKVASGQSEQLVLSIHEEENCTPIHRVDMVSTKKHANNGTAQLLVWCCVTRNKRFLVEKYAYSDYV